LNKKDEKSFVGSKIKGVNADFLHSSFLFAIWGNFFEKKDLANYKNDCPPKVPKKERFGGK
jgi:hypothetical protein